MTTRVALVLLAALTSAPAVAGDDVPPEHDYTLHCAACHGFDGKGSARVPTLHDLDVLLATEGGRAYLVRVPGVAQAPVSDARLAKVLNWVFREFGAGEPTPPFGADEIGGLRTRPLRDPLAARALILGLPATLGPATEGTHSE